MAYNHHPREAIAAFEKLVGLHKTELAYASLVWDELDLGPAGIQPVPLILFEFKWKYSF